MTAPTNASAEADIDHDAGQRWADWIMEHGDRDAPVGAATAVARSYQALRRACEEAEKALVAAVASNGSCTMPVECLGRMEAALVTLRRITGDGA